MGRLVACVLTIFSHINYEPLAEVTLLSLIIGAVFEGEVEKVKVMNFTMYLVSPKVAL